MRKANPQPLPVLLKEGHHLHLHPQIRTKLRTKTELQVTSKLASTSRTSARSWRSLTKNTYAAGRSWKKEPNFILRKTAWSCWERVDVLKKWKWGNGRKIIAEVVSPVILWVWKPDGGKDFQILAGARMCRIYEVTIRGGCTQDLACGYWILNIFWKKKHISWKTWEKNLIIKCTYLIQTNPCMQIIFTCMRSYTFKNPVIKLLTNTLYILFFITLCHLFNINSMLQKRSVDWTLPNPQEAPSLITRCKKHTNLSLSPWIKISKHSQPAPACRPPSNITRFPMRLQHPRSFGKRFGCLKCFVRVIWATFRTLLTFHYTDWFIGILIMVYYNPYRTGQYNPLYTTNNQGFGHCSFCGDGTNRFGKIQDLIIPQCSLPYRCHMHQVWQSLSMIHLIS